VFATTGYDLQYQTASVPYTGRRTSIGWKSEIRFLWPIFWDLLSKKAGTNQGCGAWVLLIAVELPADLSKLCCPVPLFIDQMRAFDDAVNAGSWAQ
jgi:hypothetical protein